MTTEGPDDANQLVRRAIEPRVEPVGSQWTGRPRGARRRQSRHNRDLGKVVTYSQIHTTYCWTLSSVIGFLYDRVQRPDLGGVKSGKIVTIFPRSRVFRGLAPTRSDPSTANQLVRCTVELRIEPVGWRHLELPSSSTVT